MAYTLFLDVRLSISLYRTTHFWFASVSLNSPAHAASMSYPFYSLASIPSVTDFPGTGGSGATFLC